MNAKGKGKRLLKRLRIGDQLNPPCSRCKGRMSLGKGKFAERVRKRAECLIKPTSKSRFAHVTRRLIKSCKARGRGITVRDH